MFTGIVDLEGRRDDTPPLGGGCGLAWPEETRPERPSACRMRHCGAMRRELPDGYELDDDVERVDVDAVHRYLSEESYGAEGRFRDTVEALVRGATRVVGVYRAGSQVGFARAVSDGHTVAYLADVYVLPEHRGPLLQRSPLGLDARRQGKASAITGVRQVFQFVDEAGQSVP